MIKGSCCCGAVQLELTEVPGMMGTCLDEDIELENKFHEFVSEKPSWLKIGDTAKQFDEHPFES